MPSGLESTLTALPWRDKCAFPVPSTHIPIATAPACALWSSGPVGLTLTTLLRWAWRRLDPFLQKCCRKEYHVWSLEYSVFSQPYSLSHPFLIHSLVLFANVSVLTGKVYVPLMVSCIAATVRSAVHCRPWNECDLPACWLLSTLSGHHLSKSHLKHLESESVGFLYILHLV